MSGSYNGGRRGGMNVSAYLQNLNAIPSADEQQAVDSFNPDDLSIFTNTQFFDFDMGQPVGEVAASADLKPEGTKEQRSIPIDPSLKESSHVDFLNDYDPFDFSQYTGMAASAEDQQNASGLQLDTTIQAPQRPHRSAPSSSGSPTAYSPHLSRPAKRKAASSIAASSTDQQSPPPSAASDNFEEASRLAAEEDKRRRNTAASARFRVKKKQKEQLLERTAKEMTDRVQQLETRINQLEMENKWLKNLVVEKHNPAGKEDTSEVLTAKYETAADGSIGSGKKDGVGTKAKS